MQVQILSRPHHPFCPPCCTLHVPCTPFHTFAEWVALGSSVTGYRFIKGWTCMPGSRLRHWDVHSNPVRLHPFPRTSVNMVGRYNMVWNRHTAPEADNIYSSVFLTVFITPTYKVVLNRKYCNTFWYRAWLLVWLVKSLVSIRPCGLMDLGIAGSSPVLPKEQIFGSHHFK